MKLIHYSTYCFEFEYTCTMPQNRFKFSTRFRFATLLLNADKSLVISSAIKTKSQHDPKKKVIIGIVIANVPLPPANSKSHAIGQPHGVRQSNGYLVQNEIHKFQSLMRFRKLYFLLTQLEILNKMIRCPCQK